MVLMWRIGSAGDIVANWRVRSSGFLGIEVVAALLYFATFGFVAGICGELTEVFCV